MARKVKEIEKDPNTGADVEVDVDPQTEVVMNGSIRKVPTEYLTADKVFNKSRVVTIDGVTGEHVSEDADGRWEFRSM